MKPLLKCAILPIALLLMLYSSFHVFAYHERYGQHNHHRERHHADEKDKHHSGTETEVGAVTNQTFKENCGACHFAYQPWLLPSGSWRKLLANLNDHFGEPVDIDASSKGVIEKYLIEYAAEKSQMKRSRKIVRCLNGETPLRITEVPYIRRKHRDIPPDVLTRKAVGSLSNCSACHKTAEQGIYDDDDVIIPK